MPETARDGSTGALLSGIAEEAGEFGAVISRRKVMSRLRPDNTFPLPV